MDFEQYPPNLDLICTSMNDLEVIINEESENKVKDTFHTAICNGELSSQLPPKSQLFNSPNLRK